MTDEFVPFPKMPRLSRECIITEKLDGTNAQVFIGDDGSIRAGSRNRWVTPEDDNYGFAAWVERPSQEVSLWWDGEAGGGWYSPGLGSHAPTHWRPLPAPPTGEGEPQGEES